VRDTHAIIAWEILDRPIHRGDSVTVIDGRLVVTRRSWWRRLLHV